MTQVIMVDGVAGDVPAIAARFPGHPVAGYADGRYAWTPAQFALFPGHVKISATGALELAAHARVLDVETGDAAPGQAPGWIRARLDAGHQDATIYCDVSNVPAVLAAIGQAGLDASSWRLWVAWWWGRPGAPTAAQVLAELNLPLDPARLWACQFRNAPLWDLSVVFGPQDFTR